MNAAQLMFLGMLCLPGLLLVILAVRRMRPRKRATAAGKSARAPLVRRPVLGERYRLPKARGECLWTALAALALCLVLGLVMAVCLSDEEDLGKCSVLSAQCLVGKEKP